MASHSGHKIMLNHKIWNIFVNMKSAGLRFRRVDVLPNLHIVIVIMMSS